MKILIVGAGLTGTCSALVLAHRGHDVTVIEKGELGRATTANSGSTGRPIVARLPARDGVFVIDGLGGNGVAFAPLAAELAAGLIEGKPDPLHPQLTF